MNLEQINRLLDKTICQCTETTNINHKPHPYCIGQKHLKRNESMLLGSSQIIEMEKKYGPMCEMYVNNEEGFTNTCKSKHTRCKIPYEEHTSDKVVPIRVFNKSKMQEYFREKAELFTDYANSVGADGFILIDMEGQNDNKT